MTQPFASALQKRGPICTRCVANLCKSARTSPHIAAQHRVTTYATICHLPFVARALQLPIAATSMTAWREENILSHDGRGREQDSARGGGKKRDLPVGGL